MVVAAGVDGELAEEFAGSGLDDADVEVLAEAVETRSAFCDITERGVDTAQGFYFSPGLSPAPVSDYMADTYDTVVAEPHT